MEDLITQYENAILKAVTGMDTSDMKCDDARTALRAYTTEMAIDHEMVLLRDFIAMCSPSEFERLKDLDFDITDKFMTDDEA